MIGVDPTIDLTLTVSLLGLIWCAVMIVVIIIITAACAVAAQLCSYY